ATDKVPRRGVVVDRPRREAAGTARRTAGRVDVIARAAQSG
ncbi:MAG: hypothetical protein QOK18_193, partial [Mycobacterium sp.]|nr:hypothetical protein [Mycobacterium sp.]